MSITALIHTLDVVLEPADNDRLRQLCGQCDEHLRLMEKRLAVDINNRGNQFRLIGEYTAVHTTAAVLQQLYEQLKTQPLTPEGVQLCLQTSSVQALTAPAADVDAPPTADCPIVTIRTKRGGQIRGRGPRQQRYLFNMAHHDISFGVGPAGTGKTYLAVARAVEALERHEVRRLVLVRPAVEAGERLGFLPGDLVQKVDPYLRPLYDALHEMLGADTVLKYMEKNIIEIAPLAFMRGRTLNEAFIILDEAQNTTVEQMKMFLTRLGFGSTAVVTGDITQVDLPRHISSGLRHALGVLEGVEGISLTHFTADDVVRHPLVQRIVNAYARYEQSHP